MCPEFGSWHSSIKQPYLAGLQIKLLHIASLKLTQFFFGVPFPPFFLWLFYRSIVLFILVNWGARSLFIVLVNIWQLVVVLFQLRCILGIQGLRVFYFVLFLGGEANWTKSAAYLLQLIRLIVKLFHWVSHQLIYLSQLHLKIIVQLLLPQLDTLPSLIIPPIVALFVSLEISAYSLERFSRKWSMSRLCLQASYLCSLRIKLVIDCGKCKLILFSRWSNRIMGNSSLALISFMSEGITRIFDSKALLVLCNLFIEGLFVLHIDCFLSLPLFSFALIGIVHLFDKFLAILVLDVLLGTFELLSFLEI